MSSRQRAGIKNDGNTCYLSAVIQALLGVVSFPIAMDEAAKVLEEKWGCSLEGTILGAWRTAITPRPLMEAKGLQLSAQLDARPLKTAISATNAQFANSQQQDASEFLSAFCVGLENEFKQLVRKQYLAHAKSPTEKQVADTVDEEWAENSPIRMFAYTLEQTTRCDTCKQDTVVIDLCTTLEVPVSVTQQPGTAEHCPTAETLLAPTFEADETVEWKCTANCKGQKKCQKTTVLLSPPTVWVLHLLRFKCVPSRTRSGHVKTVRIGSPVTLPDTWTVPPTWQGPEVKQDTARYTLRAVVQHLGVTATSGHYVTDVLEGKRQWRHYDDKDYRAITKEAAAEGRTNNALLAFYEKASE